MTVRLKIPFGNLSGADRQYLSCPGEGLCCLVSWLAAGSVQNSSAGFSCAQIIILSERNYFYSTYHWTLLEYPLKVTVFGGSLSLSVSLHAIPKSPLLFVLKSLLTSQMTWLLGLFDAGDQDDTMTASHQNVNAPAQLSPAHFLWIRAFSHAPVNGDGVTALNWVPVFALQLKVICLPRFSPLFNFLPTKTDPGAFRKREMKVWSYFRKIPALGDFLGWPDKGQNIFQRKSLYFEVSVKNFLKGIFFLRKTRCYFGYRFWCGMRCWHLALVCAL